MPEGAIQRMSEQNIFDSDGYTMYSGESVDAEYPMLDFSSNRESRIVTEIYQVKALLEEEVIAKAFLFMACALIITTLAALATTPEKAAEMLHGNRHWILFIAEFVIGFVADYAINKNNAVLVGILYTVYSYINGMVMSVFFMLFTKTSVVLVFLITACLFGVMAVFGLITKKDLSGVGSFCAMGMFGIIASFMVNLVFLKNSMVDTIICVIGVLVIVASTAYATQRVKASVENATDENSFTLALYGGFQLYLQFIYLLLQMVRLLGKRRD